jgi:hypothetical protein
VRRRALRAHPLGEFSRFTLCSYGDGDIDCGRLHIAIHRTVAHAPEDSACGLPPDENAPLLAQPQRKLRCILDGGVGPGANIQQLSENSLGGRTACTGGLENHGNEGYTLAFTCGGGVLKGSF